MLQILFIFVCSKVLCVVCSKVLSVVCSKVLCVVCSKVLSVVCSKSFVFCVQKLGLGRDGHNSDHTYTPLFAAALDDLKDIDETVALRHLDVGSLNGENCAAMSAVTTELRTLTFHCSDPTETCLRYTFTCVCVEKFLVTISTKQI